ncbi:MAG: sugar kinase [Propionibacteriaceae bacterium]
MTADVVTFGETMVALRSAGPLTIRGTLTARIAGAESNVAIGLARLGHTTRWVSRVGDDEYGRALLKEVRAEGVDVSGVRVDPSRPTGLMVAAERTTDVTSVAYYRAGSAASALGPDDVSRLGHARILHVTGITPALSPSAAEAVRLAVGLGSYDLVSLDVNHRSRLISADDLAVILRSMLPAVGLVIGSPEELRILADGGATELAGRGLEVVEKRGADGAAAWVTTDGRTETLEVPAVPVTVVDTIGAGDAFTAGYLSGLLDGQSPHDRLLRASLVAAWCVSTRGDYEGLPTRSELERLPLSPGTAIR